VYRFKFASEDSEFEQIHRLNYTAFVEEIPQHAANPERRLVDQFHAENRYAIALSDDASVNGACQIITRIDFSSAYNTFPFNSNIAVEESVVAMLALRSKRPFSLDKKLPALESYVPPHQSMCEIRLLYVQPAHRNGKVMRGLMEMVAQYAVAHGHNLALISGTTRQERFYRHFGFAAFGPLLGTGDARFQPMYLTLSTALRQTPWVKALNGEAKSNGEGNAVAMQAVNLPTAVDSRGDLELPVYDPPLNYLPGPVNIPAAVMASMSRPMISHRSRKSLDDVATLQAQLCAMVGARYVEFLFGSGTLGNEAVAGQLSLLAGRGLVLINGEFGRRLADMAQRWQLCFDRVEIPWGESFSLAEIDTYLAARPATTWIWCVHSETSTGVLNDLSGLAVLCKGRDVKLCVDCISSLGVVGLDLRDTYLATSTSGKALGAVAGVAMVFYNEPLQPASNQLPAYLDLGTYRQANGVPFTLNTNLVYALTVALEILGSRSYERIARDGAILRDALREAGICVCAPDAVASPAVTTVVLPPSVSSLTAGDGLAEHGFLVNYQSRYLVEKNWIQISLMGEYRMDALPDLLRVLTHLVVQAERVAA
jgi:aspartate aminotransferase-like enzyme/GNAT superfamily N-acetyltransferase